MGELYQNDPSANFTGNMGQRREQDGRELAGSPAGAATTQIRGKPDLLERSFAAVLIGRRGLFQDGLTSILSETDFCIAAAASCVDELVLSLLPQEQRLLLIVDAGDDLNFAAGQIELFRERHPAARVAVLTDADQLGDLLLVFRAGAHACFASAVTRDVLLRSLELVMLGETFLLPGVLPLIADRKEMAAPTGTALNKGAALSAQEKCVLRYLAEGHSNKVIANKIDIAVATVKVHVNSIFRKIGTCNRTQAAIWARNNISQEEAKDEPAALPAPRAVGGTLPDGAAHEVVSAAVPKPDTEERPILPMARERSASGARQDAPPKETARNFGQEELARRAQRRLAEEEERHAEMLAKTNHLRELRKAREAAELKALDCTAAKLSPEAAEMKALISIKPSGASADERSSQQPGVRLA